MCCPGFNAFAADYGHSAPRVVRSDYSPASASVVAHRAGRDGSGRWGDAADEAQPHRGDERLGTVGGAELLVDAADVALGRRLAEEQLGGDRRDAEPLGEELEHLALPVRELRRP